MAKFTPEVVRDRPLKTLDYQAGLPALCSLAGTESGMLARQILTRMPAGLSKHLSTMEAICWAVLSSQASPRRQIAVPATPGVCA